jgi:hypothetical protein
MSIRNYDILQLKCNICEEEYRDINELMKHLEKDKHLEIVKSINEEDALSLVCLDCNYETNKKHRFIRHINSVAHNETKGKNIDYNKYGSSYVCKLCNKYFSNRSNYTKHLKTGKHKMLASMEYNSIGSKTPFVCICGKSYIYKKSLDAHGKTCKKHMACSEDSLHQIISQLVSENKTLHEQLIEIAKEPKVVNNNTTNYNTINMVNFLNDECKDAINFHDFIENLEIDFTQLEDISKYGYIYGIQQTFVKEILGLNQSQRPIHCTDTKRFTFYLKENHGWNRENGTENLDKALNRLVNKQFNCLQKWKLENPDWSENREKYDTYVDIMSEIMKGDSEKDGMRFKRKAHKLIGSICKLDIDEIVQKK